MPSKPRAASRSYTITELALEFDITARAIRFYEDLGLLTPQRAGRNRIYTQRDRTRLKLTLRGKRLGFSLQEIKQLVDMYDSPSDTAQQLAAFMAVLAEHRQLLEQQREDIDITLAEIAQHEARCRSLLAAAHAVPASAPAAEAPAALPGARGKVLTPMTPMTPLKPLTTPTTRSARKPRTPRTLRAA